MKKREDGYYYATKMIKGKRYGAYGSTRAEAQEKLNDILRELKRKNDKDYTFNELCEQWQKDKWDSFAYGTQNGYREAMERAKREFGEELASEITPLMVLEILEEMKRNHYSLKSVKNQKTVISTIFRHGIMHGMCETNPATSVELPNGLQSQKREMPSDEAIEKIAKSDYLPALVMMYTGCRRGEALALEWKDIDFEKNLITVNKQIIFQSNVPIIKHSTKTSAGCRKIPLLKKLADKLPSKREGRLMDDYTLRRFKTDWMKFEKSIGEHVTPHQLRHYYASLLYDASVDVKQAQVILGHSELKMTTDLYTHIKQSKITDVTNKLNDFIG